MLDYRVGAWLSGAPSLNPYAMTLDVFGQTKPQHETFQMISMELLGCGINFEVLMEHALENTLDNKPFVIVDIGASRGIAAESIARVVPNFLKEMGSDRPVEVKAVDLYPRQEELTPQWMRAIERFANIGYKAPVDAQGQFDPEAMRERFQRMAQYIKADITALPFEDNSVDMGYSTRTLIYVADVLKALEEGYRVLKHGGVMAMDIEQAWVSWEPGFLEILEKTPGASDVFSYHQNTMRTGGAVVIQKKLGKQFPGFPYEMVQRLSRPEVMKRLAKMHGRPYQEEKLSPLQAAQCSAVYREIENFRSRNFWVVD